MTQAIHDFVDEKMTKPPQEVLLTTENLGLLTNPEVNLSVGKDILNACNGKISGGLFCLACSKFANLG